ncbi:tetratricopeptide repeat protein [Flagellimonas sp. DF-77]|uniref:tetratricopeptide repeat protein n=1 Tax=Flagellimonas algarum TaxID=3230298 RepID=UPI003399AA68
MKALYYIGALLLLIPFGVHGQNKRLDSLQNGFGNTQLSDSIRFHYGITLAQAQLGASAETSRQTGHDVLNFAEQVGNKAWEAKTLKWIGITHAEQGQYQKAHEYFFRNHDMVKALGLKKEVAIILGNIGTVYYELGNYPQAQDYLLQSLKQAEALEDKITISRALNNLGNVHSDWKNLKRALGYYQRSLEIKESLGMKNSLQLVYNNIGLIQAQLGNVKQAIDDFEKSVALSLELGDLKSESRGYSNLGAQYSQLGDFDKALEFMNKGLQIKKVMKDDDGLTSAYIYRGNNFLAMGRFVEARIDCQKGLDMAVNSGAINSQKMACNCLGRAYEGLGDYRRSLSYNQRFATLKDSLFNIERSQEMTRAEMTYEFEKQQLADSIQFHKQQTEQKVAYERQLNKQNTKFYLLLMVSLGVIGFMTFLYYKYRQNLKLKKVENRLLNTEIEYKKKDLTTMAVNISNNQEWAESLGERLNTLKAATGRKRVKELELLEADIKNKIWVNKDSDAFHHKIDELSSSFYARLNEQFEGLTKTEVRLCSFIKLDLNTKQIATLQNINPASVKMSRNRLRKKLNLSPEDDLTTFLRNF